MKLRWCWLSLGCHRERRENLYSGSRIRTIPIKWSARSIVLLAAAAGTLGAQTPITYSGPDGGAWTDSGNWNPAEVPSNNGGTTYAVSQPLSGVEVVINGVTIAINDLTLTGDLGVENGGNFTVLDDTSIASGSTLEVRGRSVANLGDAVDDTLTLNGDLKVSGSSSVDVEGTVDGSGGGTIFVDSAGEVHTTYAGTLFDQVTFAQGDAAGGIIRVTANSEFDGVSIGAGLTTNVEGRLKLTGTNVNDGLIRVTGPYSNFGLNINGAVTLSGSGTTEIVAGEIRSENGGGDVLNLGAGQTLKFSGGATTGINGVDVNVGGMLEVAASKFARLQNQTTTVTGAVTTGSNSQIHLNNSTLVFDGVTANFGTGNTVGSVNYAGSTQVWKWNNSTVNAAGAINTEFLTLELSGLNTLGGTLTWTQTIAVKDVTTLSGTGGITTNSAISIVASADSGPNPKLVLSNGGGLSVSGFSASLTMDVPVQIDSGSVQLGSSSTANINAELINNVAGGVVVDGFSSVTINDTNVSGTGGFVSNDLGGTVTWTTTGTSAFGNNLAGLSLTHNGAGQTSVTGTASNLQTVNVQAGELKFSQAADSAQQLQLGFSTTVKFDGGVGSIGSINNVGGSLAIGSGNTTVTGTANFSFATLSSTGGASVDFQSAMNTANISDTTLDGVAVTMQNYQTLVSTITLQNGASLDLPGGGLLWDANILDPGGTGQLSGSFDVRHDRTSTVNAAIAQSTGERTQLDANSTLIAAGGVTSPLVTLNEGTTLNFNGGSSSVDEITSSAVSTNPLITINGPTTEVSIGIIDEPAVDMMLDQEAILRFGASNPVLAMAQSHGLSETTSILPGSFFAGVEAMALEGDVVTYLHNIVVQGKADVLLNDLGHLAVAGLILTDGFAGSEGLAPAQITTDILSVGGSSQISNLNVTVQGPAQSTIGQGTVLALPGSVIDVFGNLEIQDNTSVDGGLLRFTASDLIISAPKGDSIPAFISNLEMNSNSRIVGEGLVENKPDVAQVFSLNVIGYASISGRVEVTAYEAYVANGGTMSVEEFSKADLTFSNVPEGVTFNTLSGGNTEISVTPDETGNIFQESSLNVRNGMLSISVEGATPILEASNMEATVSSWLTKLDPSDKDQIGAGLVKLFFPAGVAPPHSQLSHGLDAASLAVAATASLSATFYHNISFESGSILEFQIGLSQFAVADFQGTLTLTDVSLNITLDDGALPGGMDQFAIITTQGLDGLFNNVANGGRLFTTDGTGSFQVNYGALSAFAANDVTLSDFQLIPEPATVFLFGFGLVATIGLSRPRRRV